MSWRNLTRFQQSIVVAGASQLVLLGTLLGLCAALGRPALRPYLHVLVYPACVVLALVGLWHYRLIEKMNAEHREDRLRRFERSTGTTSCRKCLHDLRASKDRCPECGTLI